MKVQEYDFRGVSQEQIDFKDDVTKIINFGKMAVQRTASVPTWMGQAGEMVLYASGTTGRLYIFAGTGGTSWTAMNEFVV